MKKQHVKLTKADRQSLETLLSKGELKVRVQKRAMALQMLDKGMSYQQVKDHIGIGHISLNGPSCIKLKVFRCCTIKPVQVGQ